MLTRTVKSIALIATVAASSIGCAPTTPLTQNLVARPQRTVLTINNHNWSDMKVYALIGGVRFRLGTVVSMTTARIDIPQSYGSQNSEFRLILEPIGARTRHVTDGILFDHGTNLECTIQNNLRLSTLWIRR